MESAPVVQKEPVVIDLKQISGPKKIDKTKIFLAINAVVLSIATVGTFGAVHYVKSTRAHSSNQKTELNSINSTTTDLANESIEVEDINTNPFNGLPLSEEEYNALKNRPLAVMMDNSAPAHGVQENINRADVVYEGITEYGITRFMGIFYSDQSNFRVMPVRSVRMVFLDNLREYNDPLLYHVGGAFTPERPQINAVQKVFDEKVKSIYYYKHNHTPTFNELYDEACFNKGVPGYSCKYHFTDTLWKKATEVGYQDEKWEPERKNEWKWKFNEKKVGKSEVLAKNIKYKFTTLSVGYNAEWDYDATTNRYTRKTGGKKHMDNAAKEQVWTNTLVVQKIKYDLSLDGKNRSWGHTVGTGDALIFMKGKEYDVTWKKDCETCRTRYYNNENGEEFVFQPGRMWISITRDIEPITFTDPSVTPTTSPTKTPTPTKKQ